MSLFSRLLLRTVGCDCALRPGEKPEARSHFLRLLFALRSYLWQSNAVNAPQYVHDRRSKHVTRSCSVLEAGKDASKNHQLLLWLYWKPFVLSPSVDQLLQDAQPAWHQLLRLDKAHHCFCGPLIELDDNHRTICPPQEAWLTLLLGTLDAASSNSASVLPP